MDKQLSYPLQSVSGPGEGRLPNAGEEAGQLRYETPQIVSYTDQDILVALGPAQTGGAYVNDIMG